MAGIYLHIPFCKKRCIYCDFYSTTSINYKDEYIECLKKEIVLKKKYITDKKIETIYFGGGTPSQLSPQDIESIIQHIYQTYDVADNPEITIEANPDDLKENFVLNLSKTHVNRISIGIQTFNDERLKFLNRRHNSDEAIEAVKMCQNYKFENISIDLIYGFPNEKLNDWEKDIETAISLNVPHISAYHLIYEEGTPIYKMLQKHEFEEIDEDTSLNQFRLLIKKLNDAGYIHYEISNFCKKDKHSRHNTSYWTNKEYIGCGPSAHSYNTKKRFWNISNLYKYIEKVNNNEEFFETEDLDTYTLYNEYILTSLRTIWGANPYYIKEHFGERLYNYFIKNSEKHMKNKDMENHNNNIRISNEGIFISDSIMSDLMWV